MHLCFVYCDRLVDNRPAMNQKQSTRRITEWGIERKQYQPLHLDEEQRNARIGKQMVRESSTCLSLIEIRDETSRRSARINYKGAVKSFCFTSKHNAAFTDLFSYLSTFISQSKVHNLYLCLSTHNKVLRYTEPLGLYLPWLLLLFCHKSLADSWLRLF